MCLFDESKEFKKNVTYKYPMSKQTAMILDTL